MDPFWTAEAQAQCEKLESCGNGSATLYYGSVPACVARKKPGYLVNAATPGILITPDKVNACVAQLDSETCDQWNGHPDTACSYSGDLGNGEACLTSWECGSAFCLQKEGSECGTCAARLNEGDPCQGTCYPSDLVCVETAPGAGICKARRGRERPVIRRHRATRDSGV
jgi:hypothetical protein